MYVVNLVCEREAFYISFNLQFTFMTLLITCKTLAVVFQLVMHVHDVVLILQLLWVTEINRYFLLAWKRVEYKIKSLKTSGGYLWGCLRDIRSIEDSV